MKTFKTIHDFVVTTANGRKLAEGVAIEHVEPIASNYGRGRIVWKRHRQGGFYVYRQYNLNY